MGLNVDQELFAAFAFYAAIVLVKMLFMSFLTARWFLQYTLSIIILDAKKGTTGSAVFLGHFLLTVKLGKNATRVITKETPTIIGPLFSLSFSGRGLGRAPSSPLRILSVKRRKATK